MPIKYDWSSFTERARAAVYEARHVAGLAGQREVSSACLLLGLMYDPGCVAMRILDMVHIAVEELKRDIERHSITGKDIGLESDTLDDSAVAAVNYAYQEAKWLNHLHVGTEHLLLGIIREPREGLRSVLNAHRLKPAPIRRVVKSLYGDGMPTQI